MGGIASPNPMMAPPVMNPILAEIDAAHANLSPDAQAAIEKAHGIAAPNAAPMATEPPPGGGIQAPAPTTVGGGITPPGAESPKLATSGLLPTDLSSTGQTGQGTLGDALGGNASLAAIAPAPGGPLAVPSLGSKMPEAPVSHIGGTISPELARITKPDTGLHNRQNTGTPGVNQIHNPWARVPLQILDALGRGFFPGVEMALPGTSGHHDLLVAQRQGEDKLEQDFSSDEQRRELEASQAREADATALERSTKNTADNQAVVKAGEGIWDKNTKAWLVQPTGADNDKVTEVDPEIGKTLGIVPGPDGKYKIPSAAVDELIRSKMPAPKAPSTREADEPLGDRVPKLNEALTARYQILHPKQPLPPHYLLPENATHGQLMDIDKLMEAEERAHGSQDTKADSDKWRAIMLAASKENRAEKKDTQTRTAAYKAWQPAMDSGERFNVMAKNYEDAVKNHDQQAMLSLLANHLGMTMGLQKGSRLTRDIIQEAEKSRPWLQGMQAKFDKDGYLSGVNLTPPQMRQMLDLGHERFSEDVTKSRNEASYLGENEEPKRSPNKSTVRYYRALAGGDMKKAKQLAADAGWSLE